MARRSLLFLLIMAFCLPVHSGGSATTPNFVGTWKGTAPKISATTGLGSEAVTLVIVGQSGNLVRGNVTIMGTNLNCVGNIYHYLSGTTDIYHISIHGYKFMEAGGKSFFLYGTYFNSPTPGFKDINMYYSDNATDENIMYDSFQTGGGKKPSNITSLFELLLSQ
jgi:hypothetical protein